jgi:class 3 adenylate cyclase
LLVWSLFTQDSALDLMMAAFFMVAIRLTGMAGAYLLERSRRRLFLAERATEVEHARAERERERAERLLRNVLPDPIAQRLGDMPSHETAYIADSLDDVAVLFADLVGFTRQAEGIRPAELVAILDDLFAKFDAIADEVGMEKIKTVGDERQRGAPVGDRHGCRGGNGASIHPADEDEMYGDPIAARIGTHTARWLRGIGRRSSIRPLGNTVNLASRLRPR